MTIDNVLGGIGNTPLVELEKVVPAGSARIVAKLEWANPTGSMKDRMAKGGDRGRGGERAFEAGRNRRRIHRRNDRHFAGVRVRRQRLLASRSCSPTRSAMRSDG